MKKIVLGLGLLIGFIPVKAQESDSLTLEQRVKNLENKHTGLEGVIDGMKKLKISGYIQSQFQVAQSANISSFSGGNFPANIDKRFQVRRGRLKFTYEGDLAKYVMQFEATEGGVSIKEAYVKVTEPWSKWISLQSGIQTRPFGFEVGYSSSNMESPERARLSQMFFNAEEDLGAQLIINAPKTSPLNFLTLQGGFFSAVNPKSIDFDKFKDVIVRLSFVKANKNQTVNYSGGLSYYNGGYRAATNNLFEITGNNTFTKTSSTLLSSKAKREYFGTDVQVSFESPLGLTTLRSELFAGKQTASSSSTASPLSAPSGDSYLRNFNSANFYFIQAFAKTKFSIVAKYDWYNPNKDVDQSLIGTSGSNATAADIKYSTLGLGLINRWNENVKFMAYYDIVKNKSTSLAGYTSDIKDNVFTLRVQFKF